jgi:hypothetical protein
MGKRILLGVLAFALFLVVGVVGYAQETAVKGNVSGVVVDTTGAVIPQAKVTLTGPGGSLTTPTDSQGNFSFVRLVPGTYSVKVEKEGFKVADAKGVEVAINRTVSLRMQLEPGAVSETVEVTASAVAVDTTSTAVGSNLNDTFYASVPVPRNVSGLFYVAPGVADSGGSGRANPSISGGSGLENLYIADGVNITDAGFGGLGTYSTVYGSVGTGINLSFIKEVQVKTGGFEPQYGQATGGVVQIVTKSGGEHYHGQLTFSAAPTWAAASPHNVDDFRNQQFGRDAYVANANPIGSLTQPGLYAGPGSYDASAELGGYVPKLRNHLFFFGSYNPTLLTGYVAPPQFTASAAFFAGLTPPVFNRPTPGLFNLLHGGYAYQRAFTNNYAGKLTWKINSSQTMESSVFGDPTDTNTAPFRSVVAQDTTVYSKQSWENRSWVVRYNSTISPTWLANANFTWNHNEFSEAPLDPGTFLVSDRTVTGLAPRVSGVGFVQNSNADNFGYGFDTSKVVRFVGQHTFMIGFASALLNYDVSKFRTGGRFAVPDLGPVRNQAVYGCATATGAPTCPLGNLTNAEFSLRSRPTCTLCPIFMSAGGPVRLSAESRRGEYGPLNVATEGLSYAAFVNDVWTINKYVTLSVGVRWDQYHVAGVATQYTFTDNWAPRLGITYDPWGDRKTKIYLNYARYNYQLPLDAAVRSLSNELDLFGMRFAPVVGPNNSVTIIPDAAHVLNATPGGTGGAAAVLTSAEGMIPGTKMQYENEYVTGIERDLGKGFIISARYIDRRLQRAVEDMSGISPEGSLAGIPQILSIGNPGPKLDAFTNEPIPATPPASAPCPSGVSSNSTASGGAFPGGVQACYPGPLDASGQPIGVNGLEAGTPVPDGIPDGFATPVRKYQAAELELNKGFSNNWLMRFNYRLAYLRGNYEGAYRNDNGQSDPSISSLFDFREGILNLLGDQFAIGPLNTERHHVANLFVSYTFDRSKVRGLTLGTGMRIQSGTPISEFANHPVYNNQGEVPLGGRGILGRTPISGAIDLHAEYAHKMSERWSLHVSADMFNITNSMPVSLIDQNRDLTAQPPNSNFDFQHVLNFQNPFYGRFSARLQF